VILAVVAPPGFHA
jgi:hypothetical protein